ncbi:early endosome antigen 1 [Bombina bombina]|uniref:early endosome antigen 1 n=1 Tax=Bombina bombina TaxID=8345 RepID=UPI00235ADAB7|nr:early endosome antigen 1 [Bombina bombina]
MFRRILQLTPGRVGTQNSESDSSATPGNAINNESSSEGFICPLCMKSHGSAEELFMHYEASHEPNDAGEPTLSPKREEVLYLKQEVQDLQASLKEEKWYAEELKKELESIQGQLKQEPTQDGIVTVAATELQSLGHQLEEAKTEMFNIKQMKDLFEQKAAQLATEVVDLKAVYDEEKSKLAATEEKVNSLFQELDVKSRLIEDLKTELLQRPGIEDVAVLKKELIQVQTLMDKTTLERENESEKLKDECKQLQMQNTNCEVTINQLKAELAKGPQEVAVYVQELQQLKSSMTELSQKNESLLEKLLKKELDYTQLEEKHSEELTAKKNLQVNLNHKDVECQQLQARLSASDVSLQTIRTEMAEKGEANQKLKQELSEVETKYQHLKAEFKQLQQQREEKEQHSLQLQSEINQLHSKLLEAERQLGEAHGRLKEQRQLSAEKLMDKEQQVADLQLKLSRADEQLKENNSTSTDLQHQLEKLRQQHQEQQTLQQTTTSKLREAQNDLEQVLRQIGDKDQKIQNLEALLEKSKKNISLLEKEREDLYAKIQAGEGETAVLNQLQEKNHKLQEQLTQLTEKMKNQSESHKRAQENLHEQVQEQKSQLRASQDHVLSLETKLGELNSQLNESKEKMSHLELQSKRNIALKDFNDNKGDIILVQETYFIHTKEPKTFKYKFGKTFYSSNHNKTNCVGILLRKGIPFTLFNLIQDKEATGSRISPTGWTDHSMVSCTVKWLSAPHSTYVWKLNNDLLDHPLYQEKIETRLQEYFNLNISSIPDFRLIWEAHKSTIRGDLISIQSHDHKQQRAALQSALSAITTVEERLKISPTDETLKKELQTLRGRVNTLLDRDCKQLALKLQQSHYASDNRCSRLLARKLRRRTNRSYILSINRPGKDTAYSTYDISEAFRTCFKSLYNLPEDLPEDTTYAALIESFLKELPIPTITQTQEEALNSPFKLEELLLVLKDLPLGKAPGPDGFTNYYSKKYNKILAPHLLTLFNSISRTNPFLSSSLTAHISLIPKEGKDHTRVENYRPISLLNTDVKIYAKLLATRLKALLPDLIHADQVGFIPTREAKDNTVRAIDLIDYVNNRSIPTVIVSTDAEKALDRVSWRFLRVVLLRLGLGVDLSITMQQGIVMITNEPTGAETHPGIPDLLSAKLEALFQTLIDKAPSEQELQRLMDKVPSASSAALTLQTALTYKPCIPTWSGDLKLFSLQTTEDFSQQSSYQPSPSLTISDDTRIMRATYLLPYSGCQEQENTTYYPAMAPGINSVETLDLNIACFAGEEWGPPVNARPPGKWPDTIPQSGAKPQTELSLAEKGKAEILIHTFSEDPPDAALTHTLQTGKLGKSYGPTWRWGHPGTSFMQLGKIAPVNRGVNPVSTTLPEMAKARVSQTKNELQKKCEALQQTKEIFAKQEKEAISLKETQEKLKQDLEKMAAKMQEAVVNVEKAKLERDSLQKDLTDTQDNLLKSIQSLKESNDKLDKEKQKGKEVETAHEEIRLKLQAKVDSLDKELMGLKTLLEKKEGECSQLKSEIDKARGFVAKVQSVIKEKEKHEQELEAALKKVQDSFDESKKRHKTELDAMNSKLANTAEQESKLQQQVSSLNGDLTSEKGRISELQKTNQQIQEKLNQLQSDMYGKESEVSAIRQDLKSAEEKLVLAQEELKSNRNEMNNQNKSVQQLTTLKGTMEQDITKMAKQMKEQEKTLQELQQQKELTIKELNEEKLKVSSLNAHKEKIESELSKKIEELKNTKDEYQKYSSSFEDAKQLLIQQKLELQSKIDNSASALQQEKTLQQTLKGEMKKKEEEWVKQLKESKDKLAIETKERDDQKKKHEENESKLTMQITALNENLATLKKEWQSSQRRVSELEKQTDDLRGEIAVLEATVQNNQDDRRALLERYLKSEGEIEKLQAKMVELRKKLDETSYAMEELGRENQSLQIKHSQALNRKWTEDNEVQNCMECGKGFSVTIRRHHCRQCGNIFCAECSSRNALTPSSKKPVRVCNTCFIDLQG